MALFAPVGGTGKDAAKKAPPTMAEMGKKVFELNCAACHAPTGGGGACPTLIGSDWVLGNEKRLIAMVLKGIQGQMTVKPGVVTTAAMVMPAQEAALDDKKAAQALTYIRQAWGNQAGEITPEMVASVRAEFKLKTSAWTEAEINQAIPAGATISATASPANGSAGSVPATPEKFDLAKSAERGKANYGLVCGACHQPTGLGMAPAFPPLAASDYVTGDPHRLVAIIIKGVQGEITVNGVKYNGMMPATETINPLMKDDSKLADVANYVRNAFGNKSEEPVTPEMVKAMRKKLETRTTGWTESELLNFPKEK
jgi:nitrite reductase (NO-forming)